MAPTFRPYQSVGQGLNQLNLPEGASAQEAQRTMTVLSRSLDQMSQFAFRKLDEQAKVEGQKFGVEFMTDEKIKEALKSNADIFDLPQFGNTTFGKNARASALQVLENDIIINATKAINDLSYQASVSGTSPVALRNQIDSTIIGFTDSLKSSAPILSKKIQAQLELQGAREFNSYRSSYSKGTDAEIIIQHRHATETRIQEFSSSIFGNHFENGELTQQKVQEVKTSFIRDFLSNPVGQYTNKEIETKLLEVDQQAKNVLRSKIREFAVDKEGTFNNLFKIEQNIGKPKNEIVLTGDENIDKALYGKDRPVFVNDNLIQTITRDVRQEVRLMQEIENVEDERKESKRQEDEAKVERDYDLATIGDIDFENVRQIISSMTDINPDRAKEMQDEISGSLVTGRVFTDIGSPSVQRFFSIDVPTYKDLKKVKPELGGDDYKKYDTLIDGFQNERYKQALQKLQIATRYFVPDDRMVVLKSDKVNTIKQTKYKQLKLQLDEILFESITQNIDIDFNKEVQRLTQGVETSLDKAITDQIVSDLKDTLLNYRDPYVRNIGTPPTDPKEFATDFIKRINKIMTIQKTTKRNKEFRKLGIGNEDIGVNLRNALERHLGRLENERR